jgi:hypothetical protein
MKIKNNVILGSSIIPACCFLEECVVWFSGNMQEGDLKHGPNPKMEELLELPD